jgi:hypothetical protein
MESIAAQTIKDMLQSNPECTVQDFLKIFNERCLDFINSCHERNIQVLIEEYSQAVKKITENSSS